MLNAQAQKDFVRQWFEEVWNKQRTDAIDELAEPKCLVRGLGEDMQGTAGFKPFHASFLDAFPDLVVTVEDTICEGNLVAARWSASGTHRGGGLGVPATGKSMTVTGMTFARITDEGKLCEGWNSFDRLGMLQQLGVIPAM
jgi:steroid delta-isomerase-like uncharacterized protein